MLCLPLLKWETEQYTPVINHLLIYLTNDYMCVCRITLLLFTMCLTPINANISSNMTFSPISTFGEISSGSMGLFFNIICLPCNLNKRVTSWVMRHDACSHFIKLGVITWYCICWCFTRWYKCWRICIYLNGSWWCICFCRACHDVTNWWIQKQCSKLPYWRLRLRRYWSFPSAM